MKTALEMDFNEFLAWATGFVITGLGEGRTIRDSMYCVLDHALRNEVFGKAAKK